jgi:hypothetical protein
LSCCVGVTGRVGVREEGEVEAGEEECESFEYESSSVAVSFEEEVADPEE